MEKTYILGAGVIAIALVVGGGLAAWQSQAKSLEVQEQVEKVESGTVKREWSSQVVGDNYRSTTLIQVEASGDANSQARVEAKWQVKADGEIVDQGIKRIEVGGN